MLAEIAATEYRQVLDRCAEDLLWEAGIDGPPTDAFRLANQRGMAVARDAAMSSRARFGRLANRSGGAALETIVVAEDSRPERRHFAVAHEVGEANAFRVFDALGVDPREATAGTREAVANALAGRLLAPQRWLR
ncbi:MAG: ImmA/IrrE family metallo-endopeptidase, partial [Planctomycetota bacterium]